jgi:hypothetical protein
VNPECYVTAPFEWRLANDCGRENNGVSRVFIRPFYPTTLSPDHFHPTTKSDHQSLSTPHRNMLRRVVTDRLRI